MDMSVMIMTALYVLQCMWLECKWLKKICLHCLHCRSQSILICNVQDKSVHVCDVYDYSVTCYSLLNYRVYDCSVYDCTVCDWSVHYTRNAIPDFNIQYRSEHAVLYMTLVYLNAVFANSVQHCNNSVDC